DSRRHRAHRAEPPCPGGLSQPDGMREEACPDQRGLNGPSRGLKETSLRRDKPVATVSDISEKVKSVLIDALNVGEDEVTPTARLHGDLGAESIDFLDILFRLERKFGIKIPRGELFPESIFQGDPDLVQEGKVTPMGLEELRTRLPFTDLSAFEKDPQVSGISDLFTVEMITRY